MTSFGAKLFMHYIYTVNGVSLSSERETATARYVGVNKRI